MVFFATVEARKLEALRCYHEKFKDIDYHINIIGDGFLKQAIDWYTNERINLTVVVVRDGIYRLFYYRHKQPQSYRVN